MNNQTNIQPILPEILPILERFVPIGEEITVNGARRIGHIPQKGVKAYLHVVYPPISLIDLEFLETKLKRDIPKEYGSFLLESNGLSIHWCTLSLSGYIEKWDESIEAAQPHDLYIDNIDARPKDAEDTFFFFGFYQDDGSGVYIDAKDGKVYRHIRYHAKEIIDSWPDFRTFLISETKRLDALFNDQGDQLR